MGPPPRPGRASLSPLVRSFPSPSDRLTRQPGKSTDQPTTTRPFPAPSSHPASIFLSLFSLRSPPVALRRPCPSHPRTQSQWRFSQPRNPPGSRRRARQSSALARRSSSGPAYAPSFPRRAHSRPAGGLGSSRGMVSLLSLCLDVWAVVCVCEDEWRAGECSGGETPAACSGATPTEAGAGKPLALSLAPSPLSSPFL